MCVQKNLFKHLSLHRNAYALTELLWKISWTFIQPTPILTTKKAKDSPACGGTNSVSSVGVAASRSVGVAPGTLSGVGVGNTVTP